MAEQTGLNNAENGQLLAGAATSNITPPIGVCLDGPIGQGGRATYVHDELHARCLFLKAGNASLGIVVCDSTMIQQSVFEAAKKKVAKDLGIPRENLMMTATHSHSVPRATGIGKKPVDTQYLEFLSERIADGLRRAAYHIAPAKIGWTTLEKPEHLHNRRWLMKEGTVPPNPYGGTNEKAQMNPPPQAENLLRPAGPVDPQVGILSVQHADGTPLALLANYGLHYIGGVPRGHISADYYGIFCRLVEAKLGNPTQHPPFVAIMANGASGNVNNIDCRCKREKRLPYEKMSEVAADLANAVLSAYTHIAYKDTLPLATATKTLSIPIRKPDAQRRQWAQNTLAQRDANEPITRKQVFAREAILLAQYPDTVEVMLQAFGIGPIGLAAVPCEVFAETGLAIKQESPLKPTFVMSLANGYHGYLPPEEQHGLGGYETWPARSSCLDVKAEEHIRKQSVSLLESLSRS